jgi:hypothetical protein
MHYLDWYAKDWQSKHSEKPSNDELMKAVCDQWKLYFEWSADNGEIA